MKFKTYRKRLIASVAAVTMVTGLAGAFSAGALDEVGLPVISVSAAEPTWDNPNPAKQGVYSDGAEWRYESSEKTLYIDGTGMITRQEYLDNYGQTAKRIVFGKETLPPPNIDDSGDFNWFVQVITLQEDSYSIKPEICFYPDSIMATEYENMVSFLSTTTGKPEFVYRRGFPVTYLSEDGKDILCGDADMDGSIDLLDAVMLSKAVAGSVTINTVQQQSMDCDGDRQITGNDSITLMRFLLHLETALPTA